MSQLRRGIDPAPAVGMPNNNPSSPGARSLLILEAAGILGVSRRTIYYRIRDGRLQTIRTRCGSQRVLWSSIEALLREEDSKAVVRTARRRHIIDSDGEVTRPDAVA